MPATCSQSHSTIPVQQPATLGTENTLLGLGITAYPPSEVTLNSQLTIHAHSGQLQECPLSYPSPTQLLPAFFPAMEKNLECNCQVNWFMELIQKSWSWKAGFPHEFSVQLQGVAAQRTAGLPEPEWGRWQHCRAEGAAGESWTCRRSCFRETFSCVSLAFHSYKGKEGAKGSSPSSICADQRGFFSLLLSPETSILNLF